MSSTELSEKDGASDDNSSLRKQSPYQTVLFGDVAKLERQRVIAHINDLTTRNLLLAVCAMDAIKGFGFKTLKALFDSGFLFEYFERSDSELIEKWHALDNRPKVDIDVLLKSRTISETTGKRTVDRLEKLSIRFLPIGHDSYPASLLRLADPPRWIFVRGNQDLVHANATVGLVGTRSPSPTGKKLAYLCAAELAKRNVVVVSGLAKGIDERAHSGAIDIFGQTIAILGNGVLATDSNADEVLSERIVQTSGAIISEYLPFDPPSRQGFLRRNELLAAISRLVIPVECPSMDSGTGATIRRALALKTPVAGITPEETEESSIISTRKNLAQLDIPIFKVMSSNSVKFWTHLEALVADHNWTIDPSPNQERFYEYVERLVIPQAERLKLDEQAIDNLAKRLKSRIGKGGSNSA